VSKLYLAVLLLAAGCASVARHPEYPNDGNLPFAGDETLPAAPGDFPAVSAEPATPLADDPEGDFGDDDYGGEGASEDDDYADYFGDDDDDDDGWARRRAKSRPSGRRAKHREPSSGYDDYLMEEGGVVLPDMSSPTPWPPRTRKRSRSRADTDPLLGSDFDWEGGSPAAGDGDSDSKAPSSPLSLVDRILKKLDLGNIAFNTPKTMKVGDQETVTLLLSPEETAKDLAKALGTDGGAVETAERVRVAPEMEANLRGQGFKIEAVTPARQAVSTLQRTKWSWTIVPTKKGKQKLDLTLSARINVEGKDTPFVVQTFARTIVVKVGPLDTIKKLWKDHGEWLWTGILLPVGAWLWNRRKKKAATEPPSQDEDAETQDGA